MNAIFDIASRIATPLALAGFFGAILFIIVRQILQGRFITTVRRPDSARILFRIINLLFILCLVGMILGFTGYMLRLSAGNPKAPHENSVPEVAAERLSIESSRLKENYDTEIRHGVDVGGHTMPSPYFVRAFWDIMIVNNSDRDIAVIGYSIQPRGQDLPAQGPYGESYAQGLYEFATDKAIDLPFAIAAGHALRIKACSFVVILPSSIPTEVSKHWERGLPSGKIPIGDLFYEYFALHGVDFFGNEVAPGPRGINPVQESGLRNHELKFHVRTGRGTTQVATLKWY